MKSRTQFIEPLEARVAPAILVTGGNLLGGSGNPTTGETSSGGNTATLVKVLSGQALVFFDSSSREITGISVGKHTVLDITGNVYGDIITNLAANGRLTDSDNNPSNGEDGGVLLPVSIKGITTHSFDGNTQPGDIGRIIAGGSVKNINMDSQSTLLGIYTGDGIFRSNPGNPSVQVSTGSVDFNTIHSGLDNVFGGTNGILKANAQFNANVSIKNVHVAIANQLQVFAGDGASNDGGVGGNGGSISNLTIVKTLTGSGDSPATFLRAGDGGAGATAGNGGNITNFNDQGSIAYVRLQTGDGGAATDGIGGAAGSLTASTILTSSPRYEIVMGHGGDGGTGGKGGSIANLNFTNNVTGGQSLIGTGDFNADGLQDVLLINTLNGNATLSLGTPATVGSIQADFQVALQTTVTATGTVQTPFIAPVGSVPTDLVTADVNGDGALDFVVSYASTKNLGVFLGHRDANTGRGDGTFAASSVALNLSPTHIVAGDFSGTNATDIAVLSSGSRPASTGGLTSQVLILQGNGTGTFAQPAANVSLTGVATDFAVGQIDGRGGNDLFVGFVNGTIDTLLSNGTSFTPGPVITAFTSTNGTNIPVDSLDVGPSGNGNTTLLAFSKDISLGATSTIGTTVTPEVIVFTVNAAGNQTASTPFVTGNGATVAHFIGNSATIGVVTPADLTLYSNTMGVYTVLATLASDGALNDFSAASNGGTLQIAAVGAATSRFFYTEGDPFGTTGIPSFKPFDIPFTPGVISFVAGNGGNGDALAGGAGGGVSALTFKQTLGGGVLEAGGSYNLVVTSGNGGNSNGAAAGRGGDIATVDLSLNPAYLTGQDDTTSAILTTGHGGAGVTGGKGGDLSQFTTTTVFLQTEGASFIPGAVAVTLVAGDGGQGTAGAGGAGGNITLAGKTSISGVTFHDFESTTPFAPALLVQAGAGGNGTSVGGLGGSLTNIGSQNATGATVVNFNELSSAQITAGNGGDASDGNGGAGGTITGMDVSVQRAVVFITGENSGFHGGPVTYAGSVVVASGAGGGGAGGVGGAGGQVSRSTVASVDGDDTTRGFGVLVQGGDGGSGDLGGGKGGGIKKLTLNSPSSSDVYAAVLTAGDGGAATNAGAGGAGGNVKNVTQTKDVNSSISVIQAGDGGESASGDGGRGGSVKNIRTAGFIGLPANDAENLGVFNASVTSSAIASLFGSSAVPQGIFAGHGADGASAGSVLNIVARQIAAIGAGVNANGTFGAAALVSNVTADLIGYDVLRDDVFQSSAGGQVSPSQAAPIDGFILAAAIDGIQTLNNDRTAAFTFAG